MPAGGKVVDGIVRIQRQSKGRAGKPVMIITGLPLPVDAIRLLAKQLKSKCGVGGTVEDGNIVLQGDRREQVKSVLEALGYKVKLSGG
jgi:translation initiation factor 1